MKQETKEKELHPLFKYDGHINCVSGLKFNLKDPTPEMVDIHDIAWGLANQCHFGGQVPGYFSVAQHSLLVCDLMPPRFHRKPQLMMAALLHDAHEAYYGDMKKPLKLLLPDFVELEKKGQSAVFKKFGLSLDWLPTIKPYDNEAQQIEYNTFYKKTNTLQYWTPSDARRIFMNKFWVLWHLMHPNDRYENPF